MLQYTFSVIYWQVDTWIDDRQQYLTPVSLLDATNHPKECYARTPFGCADDLWRSLDPSESLYYPKLYFPMNTVETEKLKETSIFLGPIDFGVGIDNLVIKQSLIRATYTVQMGFSKFPMDVQELKMVFGFDEQLSMVKPGLSGFAVSKYEDAPGWTLKSVGQQLGVLDFGSPAAWSINNDGMAPPCYPGTTGGKVKTHEMVVTLERNSGYYILNLIFPTILLNILSWTSFFLNPEQIDVRLGTTMTIFLALVAFQIIINDALPKTGEVTKMSFFLTFSNILIVLAGLESLFVFYLYENDISTLSTLCSFLKRKHKAGVTVVVGKEVAARSPSPNVAQHDGVVTEHEMRLIHRLDYGCLILFPIVYFIVTAAVFQR